MIVFAIYGFFLGAVLSYLFTSRILLPRGYRAVSQADIEKITNRANKVGYTECKLDIVDSINQDQFALIDKLNAPNVSASHSKYKRELMQEIRELDDRKLDILKSIHDDGVELNLTITDGFDGETKQISLSEFIKEHFPEESHQEPQENVVLKSESKSIGDNVINLTDVRKGKNNATTNPSNDKTD